MDEFENRSCEDLIAYQTRLLEILRGAVSADNFKMVLELAAVSELIGEF